MNDFSGIDFNDPESFKHILGPGLPIPTYVSPAEVKRQVVKRRTSILASYATLGDMLSRHEATINKRWTKKTKAAPFREESPSTRGRTYNTKYRGSYMWPYINQEDLSAPRPLLVLLNARGHNHPSHFACFDIEATHLGLVSCAIVPLFLNEHTMMLNGVENDRYGQLLHWDDHPDAFMWSHEQRQFIPGQGLIVLEIQQRLLHFLVDCCIAMFHDIPSPRLLSDAYPPQPVFHLKPPAETSSLDSRALLREEEAYRLPAKLDLGRIASVLDAQARSAADHFWLLREDPSYFAEEILDVRSHRQELMKDSNGGTHPVLSLQRQDIFSARILTTLLGKAYTDLERFSELLRQSRALKDLHDKYAPIDPADELPNDLLVAILVFRHHLITFAKELRIVLASDVPGSPPMRGFYTRLPPPDSQTPKIRVISNPKAMNSQENYINFLLSLLWDDKQLFLFRLPLLMDELDRHLQAANHLLSARVANCIGNLSIIAQCLGELDQFYPWARTFEEQLVDHQHTITKCYDEWYAPLLRLRGAIAPGAGKLIGLSSDPKTRFNYPSGKRPSKDNVETLRKAEGNLDDFWAATDAMLLEACGNLDKMAFAPIAKEPMQRTAPWVEPPSAKSKVLRREMSQLAIDDALLTTPAPSPSAPPKTKVKTRGVAQASEASTPAGEERLPDEPSQTRYQIGVDARALKTFRTLFFNPGVSSQPGEVPWRDFRHAMAAAGFESNKLYGSAWQFQGPYSSPIIFHEPHPHPKIPIWGARRIGRRLWRTYGWNNETFVLRDAVNGTSA